MKKKGVSEIISYVLLVVIAISLSILVYSWMKTQLPKPEKTCPEETSLIVTDYSCNSTIKEIKLTLKNQGLFNINGTTARISNTSESLAIHYLKSGEMTENFFSPELKPNEEEKKIFKYKEHNKIIRIEIQPFIIEEKIVLCDKAVVSYEVEGCE